MTPTNPKEIAGRRAAELVRDGMTLGLGTGSTVWFTLQRLAERIAGEGLAVRGVPTSLDTERKARELGIPLATLEEVAVIDLTIDGADEVDGAFRLVKGGGGALLREKVVASISRREAIVVGPDKLVERLADSFPLPIEVVPFARPVVERALRALGFEPRLRRATDGGDYRTDNGNEVLEYAQRLSSRAGTQDGLYWPAEAGQEQSPFGPLAADAAVQGYTNPRGGGRRPFHGYYLKVLTRQGPAVMVAPDQGKP